MTLLTLRRSNFETKNPGVENMMQHDLTNHQRLGVLYESKEGAERWYLRGITSPLRYHLSFIDVKLNSP